MGNSEARVKRGKTLSDADVSELSTLSGFTPQQVREWHAGFLVSPPIIVLGCVFLSLPERGIFFPDFIRYLNI